MDWTAVAYSLFGALLFLTYIFVVAKIRNRYDLVDVAWGLAFISIAVISYTSQVPIIYSMQTITTILVIIWGLQLSLHVYSRWKMSQGEDRRYASLRNKYVKTKLGLAINMYLRVFVFQAILAVVISLPVIIINTTPMAKPTILTVIGVIVWVIGMAFETVGDYQLKKHRDNPKNKNTLLTTGLWKYTRHPNYFGEITLWWGIFIIALASPLWWIAIIGPVLITILLTFVTGVPLVEKQFEGRLGWNTYKKHTSKLFPLPPR